jgi:hypothetical protein
VALRTQSSRTTRELDHATDSCNQESNSSYAPSKLYIFWLLEYSRAGMDIPPDDNLKWFGEGFDGFPKHLPDDTIEYMIHIIDSQLNDAQVRSRLNDVLQAANEKSKKSLKDYIWQREALTLSLKRENDRWSLSGRTSFGDSIADEWLIVYLLRELSKQFPNAWIRVRDTDGEFLLIEAANALPKWLNPEVADNRVWINRGQLRIIPFVKDDNTSKNLTLQQALDKIKSDPASLLHSPLIEEEAFYRLQKYPEAIKDSLHCALVTIPRNLAYILNAKASFTSPAVEAFYLRDPISLRPLSKSSTSDLSFPPEDFVKVSARFNKASFAQLKSQEFSLPKAWENAPFSASEDPKDISRRELGMKLACGFEMLVQDPQNKDKKAVREISLLLEDLESGADTLPTDVDLKSWPQCEDSESWMDINFEDFERELSGKRNNDEVKPAAAGANAGFGDKAAQENLRRMVENFEKWMNDDEAGPEGAELDEMDFDDDDEDDLEGEEDSDEEDRAVSFDENEFKRMMRQMMGMPDDSPISELKNREDSNVEELDDDSEDEEIRLLSERMEAELNASGALNLDPTPSKVKAVTDSTKAKGKAKVDSAVGQEGNNTEDEGGEEGEEVQIDYNLAKNLLEAFKGQTGMAGPAGNMMGLMGITMPRDEKDMDEKK